MAGDLKPRTIIAMKGAPFTRKTTYATLIASALSCPMFRVEEFLDILGPNDLDFAPLGDTRLMSSQPPKEMAMMIIHGLISTHLSHRVVDNVVIDSITSQTQLESLVMSLSFRPKTRLIIVECKPNNLDLWKMYFADHLIKMERNPHVMWYQATSWEGVEKGIAEDESIYMPGSYDLRTSKLVLDPLEEDLSVSLSTLLSEADQPKYEPPPFMEALKYMMTRDDGPGVVTYQEWIQCPDPLMLMETVTGKDRCQRQCHRVTNFKEKVGEEETLVCMACEEQITSSFAAYTCSHCTLALHKECAESFDNTTLTKPYPNVYKPGLPRYACQKHENENGYSGDVDCASCLFETNLKHRAMPAIIRHDCDEHFLSLVLLPPEGELEWKICLACCDAVNNVFYTCEICDNVYHINCLNEVPSILESNHGIVHDGPVHHMRIGFSMAEGWDEWHYHCDDCGGGSHMGGQLEKEVSEEGWTWRVR